MTPALRDEIYTLVIFGLSVGLFLACVLSLVSPQPRDAAGVVTALVSGR